MVDNYHLFERREFVKKTLAGGLGLFVLDYLSAQGQIIPNETKIIFPSDEQVLRIGKRVRYENGPTKYAGKLKENNVVNIFMKDRDKILGARGNVSYYTRAETSSGKTATGGLFFDDEYSIAVNERLGWKLPCWAKIYNLDLTENKSTIIYAIANNHGPYLIGENKEQIPHNKRIADVTLIIAEHLNIRGRGVGIVNLEYIKPFDFRHPKQLDKTEIKE